MEINGNESKRLPQSDSVNDIKVWKKPILTQLDIKQTLTVECASGLRFDRKEGCIP